MSLANLVIRNARIYSGAREAKPFSAMAIKDGKIIALGTDDEVQQHASSDAEVRDLGGAAVLPGFVDVHNHHVLAGLTDLFEVSFSPTASFEEILDAVREWAKDLAPDAWIIGGSVGSTVFDQLTVEARHRMDEAAGGRPVALTDDSHHNKYVNTRALELAGITNETENPPGGSIVRDAETGEATGLLFEAAGIMVADVIASSQPLTLEQRSQAAVRAIEMLNEYGITAFQDAGVSTSALSAIKQVDETQGLNAWVVSSLLVNDLVFGESPIGDDLIAQREDFRTTHHRPDFIKIFLDGVPPTETGAFLTPYVESPAHQHAHCGETTMNPEELQDWLMRTAALGISAKIHCTGDAAVRAALDAIEAVRQAGFDAPMYQIAHGQFVHPDDRPRFAQLNVAADISPFIWFPGVIPEAIAAVRPEDEASQMQPNRALLDLGALVAGGSDWPVSESPNPWEGIQGLVTREDPLKRAEGALWPEQAVTLGEAIEIFTINSARAMGLGEVTGSLEVGKSADFIVLTQDPYAIPADQLIETRASQTWFEGRLVFES